MIRIPPPAVDAVRAFESLVPSAPAVTTKPMFGQPAAFVNGHLFFGVFGETLFVRLSEKDGTEARARSGFRPFEPMPGRVMGGYAVFPESVLRDRAAARRWVTRALEHVARLPAKPTRKKTP